MANMVIKRFGVFSAAKIYAVVMAGLGLILGILYGLFFIIFGAAMMAGSGRNSGAAGASTLVIGLVMMVAIPIFYGIIGFIFGAIGALIYNIAAGIIGGLELELENADAGYTQPPPPQYGANQYQPGQQQYPY
jgi:hypothetical protein